MRRINDEGLTLIQSFEGCRLTAYKPLASEKYWTIGWGHYGPDVREGQTITQAQADALLREDLRRYEAYVANPAYCPAADRLTDNQFSALVSFCYNCGAGALKTLCRGRTVAQIGKALPLYNKAGGKVLAGLVRRRAAEQTLFEKEFEKGGEDMRYNTVAECPAWARETVQLAVSNGWLMGDGGKLDLSEDMLRMLVVLHRAGALSR
jgi:GH24 family phage-related lysozyme (muramidase)